MSGITYHRYHGSKIGEILSKSQQTSPQSFLILNREMTYFGYPQLWGHISYVVDSPKLAWFLFVWFPSLLPDHSFLAKEQPQKHSSILFSKIKKSKLLKDKSFKKLTSSAGEGRKPPVPLRAVQPSGGPGRLPTTVSRSQVTPAQCKPRSVQRCWASNNVLGQISFGARFFVEKKPKVPMALLMICVFRWRLGFVDVVFFPLEGEGS